MKVHTLYTCTVKKSLEIWANTVQDRTICETVCSTVFRHCFKVIYTFLLVFTCCTELVFSWWRSQTWTWSSWPAWKMVELTSLNMVVDRLDVHACWNKLFMAWWTNRLEQRCWKHHDKSTATFIHNKTCCHAGNGDMTSDWTAILQQPCMNLVVVSSRGLHVLTYANNPCRFAKLYTICWNMIEQYCYFTNPVLSC